MWTFVLMSAVICGVMYFILTWFNAKHDNVNDTDAAVDSNLSTMIVIHGLLLQGVSEAPERTSLRIVMLTVFLIGVVLMAAYSACLTSFLAVKVQTLPFKDDKTLYYDSDYNLLTMSGSSPLQYYKVKPSDDLTIDSCQ